MLTKFLSVCAQRFNPSVKQIQQIKHKLRELYFRHIYTDQHLFAAAWSRMIEILTLQASANIPKTLQNPDRTAKCDSCSRNDK